MTDYIDDNFWGVLAMPVGLLICFGPVLVAWALAEFREPSPEIAKADDKPDSHH